MNLSHENILDDNKMKLYFTVIDVTDDFVPTHWHNHLEVIYLANGAMTAYINDVTYELHPGDILIVNPKDIHYTHAPSGSRYYLLQIPPLHLERIGSDWQLLHFEEYLPAGSNDSIQKQLADIFLQLLELNTNKPEGYHLLFLIQTYQFLYTLATSKSSKRSDKMVNQNNRDFHRVEQCMTYVKKNYQHSISLAQISQELSIAPEYFCRLFKKYTGQTFLTYLGQVRMQHFYQELIVSEDSIDLLMEKNGITNYKAFLREFKKAYGTTPHKLRMQHRKS